MQSTGNSIAMISMLLAACTALAQASREDKPTESAHRVGPNGLEGWTESYPSADGQRYPANLLIARQRHVTRRIQGDPFVWKWMFWKNGRQVAYKTGSLHFNMTCKLVDIASGRQLASLDCYRELAEDAPAWAKALQKVM
jgi:hypothetical protein